MKNIWLILLAVAVIIGSIIWVSRDRVVPQLFEPNDNLTPPTEQSTNNEPEIIAERLTVPWDIAFLPNGDMLVTERGGTLKLFGNQNAEFPVAGVRQVGEGGLHGIAIHPNFNQNNFLYLYFTTTNTTNKVVRYHLTNNQLIEDRTIIENIPGASNHNGGRIAFGPDGFLYIATGGSHQTTLAQKNKSFSGKNFRV